MNPHQKRICRGLIHLLLWQIGYYKDPHPPKPLPKDFSYPNPGEIIDEQQPIVTWVNHSTFWIQAYGKSILFDPIWNQRCSPLPFFGPKRHHPPHPSIEKIPTVDYVVISHNHYDHLDKKTLYTLHQLHPNITWIVPSGVKKWFAPFLPQVVKNVRELTWWDEVKGDDVTITAVPAQHFSGRGFFDRNRSLWMGNVITFKEGKKVYFAGDTGYNKKDFVEIGNKFGHIDLSLIPIGVYTPRRFMKPVHVNPFEAIQIHKDVSSKLSIGCHWKTFKLSSECLDRPPYDLYCALQMASVPVESFRVLQPGQSLNW